MRNSEAGDAVVVAARTWVGTPYRHQHRLKGVGVDCVGLIIGAGLEAGVLEMTAADWKPFAGYSRTPNPAHMSRAIELFMRPLMVPPMRADLVGDGSVCWMGWRENLPMHLAIIATLPDGRRSMIHAYDRAAKCAEHGFDQEWPTRVISWWRYPGVAET